jgi:epoxyqueuosine reductase
MTSIRFEILQDLARSQGLAVVAVADPGVLEEDQEHLRRWQESGFAGDMAFMQRDPALLANPIRLVTDARTVAIFGAFYDRVGRLPLPAGHGRVARYAWGRDYHKVLRKRLGLLCQRIEQHVGRTMNYRVFSDSVPLLERALARRAGLGFIGKNTMLIMPRAGSFLFLAEVLWDIEISGLPAQAAGRQEANSKAHCGTCSQCLSGCPTGALVEEKVLDARRCISYLTIEKRGVLTIQERAWLGEWVFGCDVCQDVCPFNALSIAKKIKADVAEFGPDFGVGQTLDIARVLKIREEQEFVKRFAGTPLMRTKREGLLRNAAVVAANTHSLDLLDSLEAAVREDSSPIVRAHALWGHVTLALHAGTKARSRAQELVLLSRDDSDSVMRAETSSLLAVL